VINADGSEFWLNKVTLLICQTAATKDEWRVIEARVQDDIKAYYECLVGHTINWDIPLKSQLVGDRPKGVPSPAPDILYSWRGWGNAVRPCDFFRAIQIANLPPYPKTTPRRHRGKRTNP
jgi:hypothetical protein